MGTIDELQPKIMTTVERRNSVPTSKPHPVKDWVQGVLSRFHWFLDVPPEHLNDMVSKEPPGQLNGN